MISNEERLSRLEGIIEEIRRELDAIPTRLNTQQTILMAMWGTMTIMWITTLVAIFIRG